MQSSLTSLLDHPKIAVSDEEYNRIQNNLIYFQSRFNDVTFLNTDGEQRTRKFNHLPLARTCCKKVAGLVYNEQAEITIENEVINKFVNEILLNDRFNKNFERYLESCLALGGMAMRPYFDGKTIKIAFIQAPVFLPLQSNTQDISSAAIVTKSVKSEGRINTYYTLIEFHEWVNDELTITNELYKSNNADIIGSRVLLSELYDTLEESVVIKGLSRPLFTYLKTPGMNNKDINSPLGLSIFDNAKTTIDFINRTYDEFMWEIKMGQRRVAVPDGLTNMTFQQGKDGRLQSKRRFEVEQNVFVQIGGGIDDNKIIDLTTPIRAEDYIKSINKGLAIFEMQVGVSSGMFSFDGKTMKTATEVVSENSDTYQLRNSIVSQVEHSIKELIVSICELGKAHGIYRGKIPKLGEISINLDDGVFTDRNAELDYWTKALASGIVSKQYAISKVLGVTDEVAGEMLTEINEESQPDLGDEDRLIYGAKE
ncbi:phage portal protein [Gemella sp. oral taxon 928]|uniref:phage portal protein n=1 Tax=Gemella sp. oral taxon 928 TaxID=1785995 RepID=UPI001E57BFDE|nr:phage portal protein [Gemella sp. oral taxon 928]